MSIIQGVIGSIGGVSTPRYYLSYSGLHNEGGTIALSVNWENANNINLYWSIADDTAVAGVDYTSNAGYDGAVNANGTGSTVVAYITSTADSTTEGIEYYTIKLGSYGFASDFDQQSVNINDTSVAPTTNFTIEWWQKMNSSQPSAYPRFFDVGSWSSENPGISFESSAIYVWGGGSYDSVSSAYLGDTYNTWTHWCIERYNNTMALYKNGINILSTNNLGARQINDSTHPLTIGQGSGGYWNGKMVGFHWIKGAAKYKQNFTPLRGPIDSVTNSKLLLNVVDDTNKLVDTATAKTVTGYGTYSFDSDSPFTVAQEFTATLSGAGNTLGVFGSPPAGMANVKPGWTITRVAGGWSSTVVSVPAYGQIIAAINWLNDGSDYTFTPPASIVRSTGASGRGQFYELQFDSSYTDLENVRAGWYATSGAYTDRVIVDSLIEAGAWKVKLQNATDYPPAGEWTFTPPAVTGSLVFNTGYVQLDASTDWAIDA